MLGVIVMSDSNRLMKKAIEQFENEQYELAVENFIKVFESGENREEILNILYSCFIEPNEYEFRMNYDKVDKLCFPANYDELAIDFIPVSDDIYYLYEKKECRFLGKIDINQIQKIPKANEREFYILFVSEIWDIRELYGLLLTKKWNTAYILLDANYDKFYSFFKLPYLVELLENVVLFRTEEIMNIYFNECPNAYLPQKIVTPRREYFKEYFDILHISRLKNNDYVRDNVLLTIGIPSFQRGKKAWECVNRLLECPYDSEIQIVVSNNGSPDAEYYDKIKNMDDSRITYFAFDENQGYTSNVCKVLELATGRFCILCSDEDEVLLENLPELLRFLINYDVGFIRLSGIGDNMTNVKDISVYEGLSSIIAGLGSNYVTGCCFNLTEIKNLDVMEFIHEHRGKLFLEYYVHCVIAAYLGKYCQSAYSDIILFKQGEDEDGYDDKMLPYMSLDSRMEQEISCIELFSNLLDDNERVEFIIWCCRRTFHLMGVAFDVHDDQFADGTTWRSLCRDILNRNIVFFEHNYSGNELELLKLGINKLYTEWIMYTRIKENQLLKYRLSNGILEEISKDKEYITIEQVAVVDNHIQGIFEELNIEKDV